MNSHRSHRSQHRNNQQLGYESQRSQAGSRAGSHMSNHSRKGDRHKHTEIMTKDGEYLPKSLCSRKATYYGPNKEPSFSSAFELAQHFKAKKELKAKKKQKSSFRIEPDRPLVNIQVKNRSANRHGNSSSLSREGTAKHQTESQVHKHQSSYHQHGDSQKNSRLVTEPGASQPSQFMQRHANKAGTSKQPR